MAVKNFNEKKVQFETKLNKNYIYLVITLDNNEHHMCMQKTKINKKEIFESDVFIFFVNNFNGKKRVKFKFFGSASSAFSKEKIH